MPVGRCGGCGRETNSTLSNWWESGHFGEPTECYAAWDGTKWVEGCGVAKYEFQADFAREIIRDSELKEKR